MGDIFGGPFVLTIQISHVCCSPDISGCEACLVLCPLQNFTNFGRTPPSLHHRTTKHRKHGKRGETNDKNGPLHVHGSCGSVRRVNCVVWPLPIANAPRERRALKTSLVALQWTSTLMATQRATVHFENVECLKPSHIFGRRRRH